jgi:hypothetical protein
VVAYLGYHLIPLAVVD